MQPGEACAVHSLQEEVLGRPKYVKRRLGKVVERVKAQTKGENVLMRALLGTFFGSKDSKKNVQFCCSTTQLASDPGSASMLSSDMVNSNRIEARLRERDRPWLIASLVTPGEMGLTMPPGMTPSESLDVSVSSSRGDSASRMLRIWSSRVGMESGFREAWEV